MKEYRFKITNFGRDKEEPGDILEWMSEGLTKNRYNKMVRMMFFNNQYNNVTPGELGITTLGFLYVNSKPCFALRLHSRRDRFITSWVFYDLTVIRPGDNNMPELRKGVMSE